MSTAPEEKFFRFDIREDEEQYAKFQEIIEILFAAGFFRARIKGLKDFDKVIGGMTWCISMCNVDIDINLHFDENLNIGQKIALTERIVKVLKNMDCPFSLEPHQIQGIDSIHIFPVIQWLVKKSIAYRQDHEALIKQYAVRMFNRDHYLPIDREKELAEAKLEQKLKEEDPDHSPIRKYRFQKKSYIQDEKTDVKITILEFKGTNYRKYQDSQDEKECISTESEQTENLIIQMRETVNSEISGFLLSKLFKEKSGEFKLMEEEFSKFQQKFLENSLECKEADLSFKIKQTNDNIKKIKNTIKDNSEKLSSLQNTLKSYVKQENKSTFPDEENEEKKELLNLLEKLENKRKKYLEVFRTEKSKLKEVLKAIKNGMPLSNSYDELEALISKEKEELQNLKLKLFQKNIQLSKFERKLDDIPLRPELNQYQRRFVELYNQVASKHVETKKFYILYNQLYDTWHHLNAELNLMNSIQTNFKQASISDNSNKEHFLNHFETILDGLEEAKGKLHEKLITDKANRDYLNQTYLGLIEEKRLYSKAVKELNEELKKNEMLVAQLQNS